MRVCSFGCPGSLGAGQSLGEITQALAVSLGGGAHPVPDAVGGGREAFGVALLVGDVGGKIVAVDFVEGEPNIGPGAILMGLGFGFADGKTKAFVVLGRHTLQEIPVGFL